MKYFSLLVYLLSTATSFAQKTSYKIEQKKYQFGIRAGLLNASLNAELKLKDKINLSIDAGYGFDSHLSGKQLHQ